MKKLSSYLLMSALTLVLLTACGDDEVSEVEVAVVQDYPPFEYVEDGELTGFDVDIIEAIADYQDFDVDWQIMQFDAIIPALQGNQVDAAVSAIGIREDRLEVVDFSEPYFESGQSLVVHEDSDIESLDDLGGATIVAKQGTTGLNLAEELAEEHDGDVTVLQEDAVMYLEVESGNADAVINDYPSVLYKLAEDGDESELRIVGDLLDGEDYGIAVSQGSEEVLDLMNEGLEHLFDSGEYDEIYDRYFSEEEE